MNGKTPVRPKPRLEASRLTLAYEQREVVHDLSLEIPAGKITTIVGANACGKSTLLRGLARLLQPQSGAVLLDGEAVHKLPTKDVARRMGLLPQSPVAPDGLTVEDLVGRGRYPHQGFFNRWSSADQLVVDAALESTDMTDLRERPVDELSGGQRQRAWIAMSLAQDTPIMLLDEPTTYLDLAHQIEVLDLLSELNENDGRTIVMVLHDVNQAARYSDHVVAIHEGRVHSQGQPAEIVTERMLLEVFGLAAKVVRDPTSGGPLCLPLGRRHRAAMEAAPLLDTKVEQVRA